MQPIHGRKALTDIAYKTATPIGLKSDGGSSLQSKPAQLSMTRPRQLPDIHCIILANALYFIINKILVGDVPTQKFANRNLVFPERGDI